MLYEDQVLQIGVVSEFKDFAGQLRIFIQNKSEQTVQEIQLIPGFDQSSIKVGISPFEKEIAGSSQIHVDFQLRIGGFEFPTPLYLLAYR